MYQISDPTINTPRTATVHANRFIMCILVIPCVRHRANSVQLGRTMSRRALLHSSWSLHYTGLSCAVCLEVPDDSYLYSCTATATASELRRRYRHRHRRWPSRVPELKRSAHPPSGRAHAGNIKACLTTAHCGSQIVRNSLKRHQIIASMTATDIYRSANDSPLCFPISATRPCCRPGSSKGQRGDDHRC